MPFSSQRNKSCKSGDVRRGCSNPLSFVPYGRSVHGMPGLFASDGEARDLMLGTDAGRKIYFGQHKADAWIEAGSGDAMFSGSLQVKKSMTIEVDRISQHACGPDLKCSASTGIWTEASCG